MHYEYNLPLILEKNIMSYVIVTNFMKRGM